jgi:hypothetical protein
MPIMSGFSQPVGCCMIPGGPVGEHRVQGKFKPGDTLLSVEDITPGTPPTRVDRTAEFSIHGTKGNTIVNTTTNTTGRFLHVLWASTE